MRRRNEPICGLSGDADVPLARCFLRLSNPPNYALDSLSRYESTLWRQAWQILYALNNLDARPLPFVPYG
jgi:hypothetical protein